LTLSFFKLDYSNRSLSNTKILQVDVVTKFQGLKVSNSYCITLTYYEMCPDLSLGENLSCWEMRDRIRMVLDSEHEEFSYRIIGDTYGLFSQCIVSCKFIVAIVIAMLESSFSILVIFVFVNCICNTKIEYSDFINKSVDLSVETNGLGDEEILYDDNPSLICDKLDSEYIDHIVKEISHEVAVQFICEIIQGKLSSLFTENKKLCDEQVHNNNDERLPRNTEENGSIAYESEGIIAKDEDSRKREYISNERSADRKKMKKTVENAKEKVAIQVDKNNSNEEEYDQHGRYRKIKEVTNLDNECDYVILESHQSRADAPKGFWAAYFSK
jgi:hypothetical protein